MMNCQVGHGEVCVNNGCGRPAVTSITLSRRYPLCAQCARDLQPEIDQTVEAARAALAEIAGELAAHFGTDIAAAAPLAKNLASQAIAGRSNADIVSGFSQAA